MKAFLSLASLNVVHNTTRSVQHKEAPKILTGSHRPNQTNQSRFIMALVGTGGLKATYYSVGTTIFMQQQSRSIGANITKTKTCQVQLLGRCTYIAANFTSPSHPIHAN